MRTQRKTRRTFQATYGMSSQPERIRFESSTSSHSSEAGMREESSGAKAPMAKRQSRRRDPQYQTAPELCIICQQPSKRQAKNRRRKEPLIKCSNLGSRLLDAARLHEDDRVVLFLEGRGVDNVAGDVVYHRSCYQSYTNPKVLQRLEKPCQSKLCKTALFRLFLGRLKKP